MFSGSTGWAGIFPMLARADRGRRGLEGAEPAERVGKRLWGRSAGRAAGVKMKRAYAPRQERA
jgi:hypothetical protein